MEFEEAFDFVIAKYPEEIDISDIKFHENGGARIYKLTEVHDLIELQCLDAGVEVAAMDWSLFQYFHDKSKRLHKGGTHTLKTKSIEMEKLRELYGENMSP